MKDNKIERIRQKIAMLKRQFLQEDGTGVFDQALGDEEVAAVMSELGNHTASASIPHWTRCAYSLVKFYRPTVPAKT